MTPPNSIKISDRLKTNSAVFSLILLSFLTYRWILGLFFTSIDIFSIIDTSRINSFQDVNRILTTPLMGGTSFVSILKYYRPVSTLSFSLDYAIWGLNPMGYHLTNIILHASVAVLVYFLLRTLIKDNQWVAWTAAVIFTIHPVLVESVPGGSRRQDILMAFFMLAALLAFLNYKKPGQKIRYLVLSLLFYTLALTSKELAMVFPLLIFSCSLILGFQAESRKEQLLRAIKHSIPYLSVTLVVFAWRIYILGEIGGNLATLNLKLMLFRAVDYFSLLFLPYNFWRVLSQSLGAGSLVSPFLFGFAILLFGFLTFAFIIYSISKQDQKEQVFAFRSRTRIILFLFVWILLPLPVLLINRVFAPRSLYFSVIPTSMLLAILFSELSRLVIGSYRRENRGIRTKLSGMKPVDFMVLVIVTGILLSFLRYSPLVYPYPKWEYQSKSAETILRKVTEISEGSPENTTIIFQNLSRDISNYETGSPTGAKSLSAYAIKSWLDLVLTENTTEIIIVSKANLEDFPDEFSFDIQKDEEMNQVIFNQKYEVPYLSILCDKPSCSSVILEK